MPAIRIITYQKAYNGKGNNHYDQDVQLDHNMMPSVYTSYNNMMRASLSTNYKREITGFNYN